ncbi:MAG: CrcB family protein [Nitriliruptoraceae bacterium]
MNSMLVVLFTLTAGSVATVLRFLLVRTAPVAGVHGVNMAGTVLLAVVVALFNRGVLDWQIAVIVGVGFCGALTTFSTWIALIDERRTTRPWRTVVVDVLAPSFAAVLLTVMTFIALG